jgi:hypothetical protein
MSNEPEILKGLFGADAVEEFLRDYWPDRIFVAKGDKGRLPAALLDGDLNEFDVLSRRYKGVVSFFGDDKSNHMVPVEGIDAAAPYRCGLSVYLTDVSPFFPEVERLVRQLELELGVKEGCARAGVFASPKKGGISCHYDSVDVFSIQLQGTKKFDLAPVSELRHPWGSQYIIGNRPIDDLYPQATEGFPSWEDVDFQTVEMTPGTVLYMPKGTWHRTEAAGDSIAVSIGMEAPSAAECVLEQLRLLMLQDPEWRKPLYGAWGGGGMRDSALARVRRLIDTMLEPELTVMPTMPEMRRISRMNADSRVQRTPNTSLVIGPPPADSTEEDSLLASIETADRGTKRITSEIEMPSRCAPVLRWINEQQGSFRISELAEKFTELSEDQHVQLAQTLSSAGLLKTYWFPKLMQTHASA